MIQIPEFKTIFRVALITGSITGIVLNVIYIGSIIQSFSYFTVQSNLFLVAFFIYLLFSPRENSRGLLVAKLAVTIAIMVTFTVYHLVLAPFLSGTEYDPPFLNSFLAHTFSPLMALADFLLFDRKGLLRYRDAFMGLTLPVFYFLYAQFYALFGGTFAFSGATSRYAYFFMNPDSVGWTGVMVYTLAISAFIYGFGILYVFVDRFRRPRKDQKENV